jgi:Putative restriction endonuclease
MAEKAEQSRPGLSVEAFRAFYQGRPDEERWELIDGVPMMMAPPTFVHQRIASNLERLLNDALETRDPARAAYQRGGLNLKRAVPITIPSRMWSWSTSCSLPISITSTASTSRPRWFRRATEKRCQASAKSTSCTSTAAAC